MNLLKTTVALIACISIIKTAITTARTSAGVVFSNYEIQFHRRQRTRKNNKIKIELEIFRNKIVKTIKNLLLETLPISYKQEAKYYFYEEDSEANVKEALQYFLGGIEYRYRKATYLASKNIENIANRLRELTAVKV